MKNNSAEESNSGLAIRLQGKYSGFHETPDYNHMNPLEPLLEKQGFAMLDGGLATEMESRGANLDDELWSAKMLIESPELIEKVHYDFLCAGADLIATATYQASFGGFEKAGYSHQQAKSLMQLSVDLAVLARETFWSDYRNHRGRARPLVAASIGPYGACLHDGSEYHGNYGLSRQQLIDFHRPRMQVLANTDADLFAFETIPSLLEAEALLELVQEFPDKFAWLSFSCQDGEKVCHGERFADCAAEVSKSPQIVAVGINCTAPQHVSALLESVEQLKIPLAVYPNSGEEWNAGDQSWSGLVCRDMPVTDWYDQGARLLGGCCRTSAEHIEEMRKRLAHYVFDAN